MKNQIVFAIVIIILGLFIALGPQFLFKLCTHTEDSFPLCHWTGQAEIGIGFLIVTLGICLIIFNDSQIYLGLFIGIFMTGIIALAIPHALIGGCGMMTMTCRRVAFPALTIESGILLLFSAVVVIYTKIKKQPVIKP